MDPHFIQSIQSNNIEIEREQKQILKGAKKSNDHHELSLSRQRSLKDVAPSTGQDEADYFTSETKAGGTVAHSAVIICRICKIISSNQGRKACARSHAITSKGFVIKETCPEISDLSREQKIEILKRNRICRCCLSLGENTSLHPSTDCNYLEQKKLLFLQCKIQNCKYRSSLCDKHQETNSPKPTPLKSIAIDKKCMEVLSPLAKVSKEENDVSEVKVVSKDTDARWVFISWKSLPRGWDLILFIFYYILSILRGKRIQTRHLLSGTIDKSISREQEMLIRKPRDKDLFSFRRIIFDPG